MCLRRFVNYFNLKEILNRGSSTVQEEELILGFYTKVKMSFLVEVSEFWK